VNFAPKRLKRVLSKIESGGREELRQKLLHLSRTADEALRADRDAAWKGAENLRRNLSETRKLVPPGRGPPLSDASIRDRILQLRRGGDQFEALRNQVVRAHIALNLKRPGSAYRVERVLSSHEGPERFGILRVELDFLLEEARASGRFIPSWLAPPGLVVPKRRRVRLGVVTTDQVRDLARRIVRTGDRGENQLDAHGNDYRFKMSKRDYDKWYNIIVAAFKFEQDTRHLYDRLLRRGDWAEYVRYVFRYFGKSQELVLSNEALKWWRLATTEKEARTARRKFIQRSIDGYLTEKGVEPLPRKTIAAALLHELAVHPVVLPNWKPDGPL
jgi:hypothetical protein